MRNAILVLLLAPAAALFAQTLKVAATENPAGAESSQANWSVSSSGQPILSWVEPVKGGTFAVRYSIRNGAQWSEPRTIASGRHFFHHPAELPGLVALTGGGLPAQAMMAHWIEVPSASSEAEFVYVSSSRDGIKWTAPVMAHHDKSQAQHGLASMVASGNGQASLFWLQALKGDDGPASLMRSVLGPDGSELKEEQLDADVCDCCPTSSVMTSQGLLVAYRDRTTDNIRDIAVTRLVGGRWTSPKIIFPDNWKLNACPVNAASASANGARVAVAWYTASGDKPRVEMALSGDAGATFSKAAVISTGQAYGYTSVAADDAGGAYVSWLERAGGEASILARHIAASGPAGPVVVVAKGTRQSLGYPRMVRAGKGVWIAWNTAAKVQTARLE